MYPEHYYQPIAFGTSQERSATPHPMRVMLVLIGEELIMNSSSVESKFRNGNRASDLIPLLPKLPSKSEQIDTLLKYGYSASDSSSNSGSIYESDLDSKKEFAVSELPVPDISNGVCGNDEFRMHCFKIKPCSRIYTRLDLSAHFLTQVKMQGE